MKFLDLKGVQTLVSYANGEFFHSVSYDASNNRINFYSKTDSSTPLTYVDLPDVIKVGTTAYWNNLRDYVPQSGEIIVYTDYATKEENGQTINIPGIKIGGGNAYVQDLGFVAEDIAIALQDHINDTTSHITSNERSLWNSKLNVDDDSEVVNETLIFNRN